MFPAFSFHGLSDVLIFFVVVRMKACGLLRSYLVGAAGGASLTVKRVCEAEVFLSVKRSSLGFLLVAVGVETSRQKPCQK